MSNLQGSSNVCEAETMESIETLRLNRPDDRTGSASATRSRGLTGFVSFMRSFGFKLMGVLVAAQEIGTVSAEDICRPLDRPSKKFDLIGLITVFGPAAATKSLAYSAMNDGRFFLTGYIGPGSLSVAAALFRATGFRLASLLALKGKGNAHSLVDLHFPEGLRYIGLNSNTECPVANAVGACVVREHGSLWKGKQREESEGLMASTGAEPRILKSKGRDAKRNVKVMVLKLGRREEEGRKIEDMQVSLKASAGSSFFLGWLPLFLTIGVLASCCMREQWVVAGLIFLGTLGMMLAVSGLRLYVFTYSKPQVARGAPQGDCLVLDDTDADTLHIVLGEEEHIQTLFQRKINYQASLVGKYTLFFAASILYTYVIASVLYLPDVSNCGQTLFAIANLIGFVTDVFKAFQNGKLGLAKNACEQFKIVARDLVVFNNRTAAVAFVAKYAKDRTMLKSKGLLPCTGPVWEKWWEVLAKCEGEGDSSIMKTVVAQAEDGDQELLQILLKDMAEGLEAG